ncbi:MAG: SGNH/GDSL hydrolase family protein [Desulfatibacillum sp.]|nr:SGNH/GDSL hydrolase family protein [Desulfatibacillum sp.]
MKKSTKTLLSCCIALIVLVILAEVELRALGAYGTWEENNQGEYVSPFAVQKASWHMLRPSNEKTKYSRPEFSFPLTTNSLGLRDTEHAIQKPQGSRRIVILGDSLVEGQGAPFESTWPKILEKHLNRYPGPVTTEILMGGVAGSDPFFCVQLLEDRLLGFQPDMLVMALSSFDIMDIIARGGKERFLPDNRIQYNTAPFWEPLFAKSRLVRFVFIRLLGYDWLLMPPKNQTSARKKAHDQIVELALDLDRLGRENGFSPIFVLQPHIHELQKGGYDRGLEDLGEKIRDAGIEVVDLLPCMEKTLRETGESLESFFWEKDYHPNSQGYALYADCVGDYLTAARLP